MVFHANEQTVADAELNTISGCHCDVPQDRIVDVWRVVPPIVGGPDWDHLWPEGKDIVGVGIKGEIQML